MARARAVGAEALVTASSRLVSLVAGQLGPLASSGVAVSAELVARDPQFDALRRQGAEWPPVAITAGAFGIATTGSVVLAETSHRDRELSLLCRRHIVLMGPRILPTLGDTVPWLRRRLESHPRPYVSFVTGPSRTSDIERVLTIGVHGPAELLIVLVEDWEGIDA